MTRPIEKGGKTPTGLPDRPTGPAPPPIPNQAWDGFVDKLMERGRGARIEERLERIERLLVLHMLFVEECSTTKERLYRLRAKLHEDDVSIAGMADDLLSGLKP